MSCNEKSFPKIQVHNDIGHIARKPVYGVCDKVELEVICLATKTSYNLRWSKFSYYTLQKVNNNLPVSDL